MNRKPLLLILLLLSYIIAFSQEKVTIYYDFNWRVVKAANSPFVCFYREVKFDKNHKPVGKIKDYYKTGELQSEVGGALYIDSVDDKKSIFIKTAERYFRSGKKESETVCDDNGVILSAQGWYEDGKQCYTIPYKNGKRNGVGKNYYQNGNVSATFPYTNDSLDGTEYNYFINDSISSEVNYVMGKKSGPYKSYYITGTMKTEGAYNSGKKEGMWKQYYADGKLESETTYVNGMKNGIEMGHYENGLTSYTETWIKDSINGTRQTYYKNGAVKEYVPYTMNRHEGVYKLYDSTGRLQATYEFAGDKLNGNVTQYWENGKVKRKDKYEGDSLMSGECFDSTGKQAPYHKFNAEIADDPVYTVVQVMPKFNGDINEYISGNLHYPDFERGRNITGIVYVNFIVGKDGYVTNVRVIKGVPNGLGLDREAVRVISEMPKWSPGIQNGKPVNVSYNIPIRFILK